MKQWCKVWAILCMGVVSVAAKPIWITGSETHREREIGAVAPFSVLKVSAQAEVDLQQGPEYGVYLYGPDNLIDKLEVSSEEDVLSIRYKEPLIVKGDHQVRVLVNAPELKQLEVTEKGEVRVIGPFELTQLTILANGKAEIDLEDIQAASVRIEAKEEAEVDFVALTCQNLQVKTDGHATVEAQRAMCPAVTLEADNRSDIELSGLTGQSIQAQSNHAAEIELKGKVNTAALTARGRSIIKAGSLQAQQAEVMAANGSFIDVRVSDTLNAQTDSRGVVKYRGWPKEINRSGKGLVRKNE